MQQLVRPCMQPTLMQQMRDCMPGAKLVYLLIWTPARSIKVRLFLGICEQLIGSLQQLEVSRQYRRLASASRTRLVPAVPRTGHAFRLLSSGLGAASQQVGGRLT